MERGQVNTHTQLESILLQVKMKIRIKCITINSERKLSNYLFTKTQYGERSSRR